jgi:hypothetical protein
MLGDALHSEDSGAAGRWARAMAEYARGFDQGNAMAAEAIRNIGTLMAVFALKARFGPLFHFLKGNHDNVAAREGGGDHPMGKYAQEGRMLASFISIKLGAAALKALSRVESSLPLAARGGNFLASHAEPRRAYSISELIECRLFPGVVEGLTWTNNGESAPGAAREMLDALLPDSRGAAYLCGHRYSEPLYSLRASGAVVQFHHPLQLRMAVSVPGEAFEPSRDVIRLD